MAQRVLEHLHLLAARARPPLCAQAVLCPRRYSRRRPGQHADNPRRHRALALTATRPRTLAGALPLAPTDCRLATVRPTTLRCGHAAAPAPVPSLDLNVARQYPVDVMPRRRGLLINRQLDLRWVRFLPHTPHLPRPRRTHSDTGQKTGYTAAIATHHAWVCARHAELNAPQWPCAVAW